MYFGVDYFFPINFYYIHFHGLQMKKTTSDMYVSCVFFKVRRAVFSARRSLMKDFVQHNMGFGRISRDNVIVIRIQGR